MAFGGKKKGRKKKKIWETNDRSLFFWLGVAISLGLIGRIPSHMPLQKSFGHRILWLGTQEILYRTPARGAEEGELSLQHLLTESSVVPLLILLICLQARVTMCFPFLPMRRHAAQLLEDEGNGLWLPHGSSITLEFPGDGDQTEQILLS